MNSFILSAVICALLGISSLAFGQDFVSSEELRMAYESKHAEIKKYEGRRYEIIAKIRQITNLNNKLKVGFTGIEANFEQKYADKLSEINPGEYISLSCTVKPYDESKGLWPQLDNCTELKHVLAVSAEDYYKEYSNNQIRADKLYKDKRMVIYGELRQVGKLLGGSTYLSLHAIKGWSDVVAIMDKNMIRHIKTYKNESKKMVLACVGGFIYNEAGTHGLKDCKFLTSY